MKKLEKSGNLSKGEWIYYYVHRYWRLMPPYVIIIAIYAGDFSLIIMKDINIVIYFNIGNIKRHHAVLWQRSIMAHNQSTNQKIRLPELLVCLFVFCEQFCAGWQRHQGNLKPSVLSLLNMLFFKAFFLCLKCMGYLWYIPNDYQFYALSSLFIVLLFKSNWKFIF